MGTARNASRSMAKTKIWAKTLRDITYLLEVVNMKLSDTMI
jgi:hypothetical protein